MLGLSNSLSTALSQGLTNFSRRKYKEAIQDFDNCVSQIANEQTSASKSIHATVLKNRGISHLSLQNIDKALADLRAAQGLYEKEDFQCKKHEAYCYYLLGEIDKALELYNQVLSNCPNLTDCHYMKALCLRSKGIFSDALKSIMQAKGGESDLPEIKYTEGLIYLDLRLTDKALACFEACLSKNERFFPALKEKFQIISRNDPKRALEEFKVIREAVTEPSDELYKISARIYSECSQKLKSETSRQEAITLGLAELKKISDQGDSEVIFMYGVFEKDTKVKMALLEKVIQVDKNNSEAKMMIFMSKEEDIEEQIAKLKSEKQPNIEIWLYNKGCKHLSNQVTDTLIKGQEEYLMLTGRKAISKKNLKIAFICLQEAVTVTVNKQFPEAQYALGIAHFYNAEYQKAYKCLEIAYQIFKQQKNDVNVRRVLIDLCKTFIMDQTLPINNSEPMMKTLDQMFQNQQKDLSPSLDSYKAYISLARYWIERKNIDEANKKLQAAVSIYKTIGEQINSELEYSEYPDFLSGYLLYQLSGDIKKAMEHFEKCKDNPLALKFLAFCQLRFNNRLNEVDTIFLKIQREYPNESILDLKAYKSIRERKYAETITSFQQLLSKNPKNSKLRIGLVRIAQLMDHTICLEESSQQQKLIDESHWVAQLKAMQAISLLNLKREGEAKLILTELSKVSENIEVNFCLEIALALKSYKLQSTEACHIAKFWFIKAVQSNQSHPIAQFMQGLHEANSKEESQKIFIKANTFENHIQFHPILYLAHAKFLIDDKQRNKEAILLIQKALAGVSNEQFDFSDGLSYDLFSIYDMLLSFIKEAMETFLSLTRKQLQSDAQNKILVCGKQILEILLKNMKSIETFRPDSLKDEVKQQHLILQEILGKNQQL